ncbi:MAG: hypothetical protein M0Q92_12065 [Methanoregula sp.]|jgi:hypothetical protein|nr:hypothetical protein [Methanoregula sp.]
MGITCLCVPEDPDIDEYYVMDISKDFDLKRDAGNRRERDAVPAPGNASSSGLQGPMGK